jgi:hypothetical protein
MEAKLMMTGTEELGTVHGLSGVTCSSLLLADHPFSSLFRPSKTEGGKLREREKVARDVSRVYVPVCAWM